jgi:hypothetical protein
MDDLRRLVARVGKNKARYIDPAFPSRPLSLYSARPRHYTQTTPILFVHHGEGRNGRKCRKYMLKLVDEHDMLVITPEFSEKSFPGGDWYNRGNVLDDAKRPNSEQQRTYAIIERLFATLAPAARPSGPPSPSRSRTFLSGPVNIATRRAQAAPRSIRREPNAIEEEAYPSSPRSGPCDCARRNAQVHARQCIRGIGGAF